jgi:hypothetical protein
VRDKKVTMQMLGAVEVEAAAAAAAAEGQALLIQTELLQGFAVPEELV